MTPPERTPTQRAALAAVGELLMRAHARHIKKSPGRDNGASDGTTPQEDRSRGISKHIT